MFPLIFLYEFSLISNDCRFPGLDSLESALPSTPTYCYELSPRYARQYDSPRFTAHNRFVFPEAERPNTWYIPTRESSSSMNQERGGIVSASENSSL